MSTKTCPVRGCHSLIEWSRLVCHWHWKRLPAETRDDLSRLHHRASGSKRELAAILNALDYLATIPIPEARPCAPNATAAPSQAAE